ncbi:DUS1L [Symbiodinium natans]|uniref:tRNA-dihydrouridine(16/17) synthase [NAD(P)(+)] n=1 Tax=Symbiodinium natans TaxID=878477 RepID=A0A812QGM1_9DINO|nr:DUS1L [Symbiodinium natans]
MAFAGKGGQCCPICSQSFMGTSLKYHIKVCARQARAQLVTCSSCGRPVQKDDLPDHLVRCKRRLAEEGGRGQQEFPSRSEEVQKLWQDKSSALQTALAKIEAGEIGSLDPRGFFLCSICGQQGLGLLQIVEHEADCRRRLSQEGHVTAAADVPAALPATTSKHDTSTRAAVVKELNLLKTEIAQEASGDEETRALLALTLDRLRDVARNACFLEEKKYRRLRLSNPAVSEAIGRWDAAKRILQALGFELVSHTTKSGASPEPHLMLPGQLSASTLQDFLDALDGKADQPAATSVARLNTSRGHAGAKSPRERSFERSASSLILRSSSRVRNYSLKVSNRHDFSKSQQLTQVHSNLNSELTSAILQPMHDLTPGVKLYGYWEPEEEWYACKFVKHLGERLKVKWDDGTVSVLAGSEVRKAKRKSDKDDVVEKKIKLSGRSAISRLVPKPRFELPAHRYVLAPMVGGSELPFRMMTRKFGAQLCYTPMIYSGPFSTDADYRAAPENGFQTCPEDRPLVAHFCGNDPEVLLAAARHIVDRVDAIDLNLGCPQRVAHAEHFGAYLLDKKDRGLVCSIVKRLSEALPVPVFCKIRLLDELEETLELVKQLEASGASLIAVHGRYRGTPTHRRDGPAHLDQACCVFAPIAATQWPPSHVTSLTSPGACHQEGGACANPFQRQHQVLGILASSIHRVRAVPQTKWKEPSHKKS